jgi:GAF domain-containing protein
MAEDQTPQDADIHDFYTALYRVARAINSSLDEDEVLQLVARNVTEAIAVKGCAIRLLSPGKERLDLIASHGLSEEYLGKGVIRPELAIALTEALAGRPVVANIDEPEHWQYPEEARREGIATVLTVPLLVEGTPLGVLRLYASERRQFSPQEVEFVSALADLSALALHNAELHQEVKKSYELLSEYAFGAHTPRPAR